MSEDSKSKVSKFLENKQLIHIATEVVAFIALTFYFSSKNRKLMEHIEDLSHRLEKQEDHIQKLQGMVENLGALLQTQVLPALRIKNRRVMHNRNKSKLRPSQPVIPVPPPVSVAVVEEKPKKQEGKDETYTRVVAMPQQPSPATIVEEDVEEDPDNSDLDEELQDELNELENDN